MKPTPSCRMRRAGFWLLGLGLAVVGLPGPARASPSCDSATEQGVDSTVLALEEEFLRKGNPDALGRLAQAAKAAGRALDAINLMRSQEQLRHRPVPPLAVSAQRLGLALPGAVSELLIFGTDPMTEATVRLDGRLIGVLPSIADEQLTLHVSQGPHCLRLEKASTRIDVPLDISSQRPWEVRLRETGIVTVQPTPRFALLLRGVALTAAQDAALRRGAARAAFPELVLGDDNDSRAQLAGFLMREPCQDHSYAKTQYVLRIEVAPPAAPPRAVSIELIHTATGSAAAAVREPCRRCDADELMQLLPRLLPAVLQLGRQQEHGCLSVRSQPAGAVVRVTPQPAADSSDHAPPQLLGQTPVSGWLRRALFAGSYEVAWERPGFAPTLRQVELAPGDTKLEATLVPLLSAQPAPLYKRWWLWQSVAATATLSIVGGVAWSLSNR